MNNKKIIVIPSFYPTEDNPNIGIFFKEQSESLLNFGWDIIVIYAEQRSIKNFSLKLLQKNYFQTSDKIENGVRCIRKHRWNIVPTKFLLGQFIWARAMIKEIDRYIKQNGKPDIIHAHCSLWGGYVSMIISKKYHIPYIITEHSTKYGLNTTTNLENRITRKVFLEASSVIVVSNPFKRLLTEKFNLNENNIQVIPNFINTDFFYNFDKKEKNKFQFLTICYLNPKKRIDRLIKAFTKEFKGDKRYILKIGGKGDAEENLMNLVKKLEMEKQILFLGELSRYEVRENIWKSNCFVLPSDVETFGVVLIESLSAGIPVISTKSGGPEDIVTPQNGYLVERSEEQLRIALRKIVNNEKLFNPEQIRKKIINKFSNIAVSKQIIEVYNKSCSHNY